MQCYADLSRPATECHPSLNHRDINARLRLFVVRPVIPIVSVPRRHACRVIRAIPTTKYGAGRAANSVQWACRIEATTEISPLPPARSARRSAITFAMPDSLWGVVGGLGPRASAQFLKTIYDMADCRKEQLAPAVILLSKPDWPDRTFALRANHARLLAERLQSDIEILLSLGATDILICCVTLHAVLDHIPHSLKTKIVSLVDTLFETLRDVQGPHLMCCSSGSRESRLFEAHSQWSHFGDKIILPAMRDQDLISLLIEQAKVNRVNAESIGQLVRVLRRLNAQSFIAGCTEFHILKRWIARCAPDIRCVDPLQAIAARIVDSSAPESDPLLCAE